MKEKLNIAEILKNCPKGMELDCTMYEDVYFDYVDELNIIHCYVQYETHKASVTFNIHGAYNSAIKSKCVIFPKGKTTWEGFHRPFKDGDILAYDNRFAPATVFIYRYYDNRLNTSYFVGLSGLTGRFYKDATGALDGYNLSVRFATEEEKQKLFDAIKANGYKWNAETKTLDKLIEPKFKVGDKVLWNYDTEIPRTISKIELTSKRGYVYWIDCKGCSSGWWDETELTPIPNKFDITTLKPFKSRVLVRSSMDGLWKPAVFGFRNGYNDNAFYIVGGSCWKQCIPYLNNEHLCGTTNDCDDYYKTWE